MLRVRCLVAGVLCAGVALPVWAQTGSVTGDRPLVLTEVTLLSFDGSAPRPGQTIVVRSGKITQVGPAGSIKPPAGSQVISLRDKVAMAGLIDMHVHNIVRDRWKILGYGITSVRGMWGYPTLATFKDSVDRGLTPGPWITSASPGLDGRPGFWPLTQFVDSLSEVAPTVTRLKREGWTWLKVYSRLSLPVYDSIVATAKNLGIPFLGHVPFAVPVEHALAAGQLSIEHLSGYNVALNQFGNRPGEDSGRIDKLVRATVKAGSWNCPTLTITNELARRSAGAAAGEIVENRRRLVNALYRGGARLLIGTDSGIDIVPAGAALIDELDNFTRAGIPASVAFRIATLDAAEFLGKAGERGQIQPGMEADILILDADPTRQLSTLRTPAGLVLHGSWVPSDTLAAWRNR